MFCWEFKWRHAFRSTHFTSLCAIYYKIGRVKENPNGFLLLKHQRTLTFVTVFFSEMNAYFLCGPSWSWSYGSWISNYLFNQCPSPLKLHPAHGKVYLIQHYVMKFVSELRQVVGIFLFFCFLFFGLPPPIKLTAPWYGWNIVESDVKQHNPTPFPISDYRFHHAGKRIYIASCHTKKD